MLGAKKLSPWMGKEIKPMEQRSQAHGGAKKGLTHMWGKAILSPWWGIEIKPIAKGKDVNQAHEGAKY